MSIMVSFVLFFMVAISGNVVQLGSENILREVVHDNMDEIEYNGTDLDFNEVELIEDGVTTLIYSSQGTLLYGYFKIEFEEPLLDGVITKVNSGSEQYLLYDRYVQGVNFTNDVYVRGIISITSETKNINMLLLIAFMTLPIFVILLACGSYWICKKSLKPLDKMIETTEMIIQENDLSLRVGHNKGKDEVSRLAISFDKMLDKLSNTLEKEKQFTSGVSHELRTPVAVILAQCELMEESETHSLIKVQALKIRLIINQLLKLIRLENGLERAEFEQVDLSELVELICSEQRDLANIEIQSQVEEGIIANLDYAMIMRIVTNLINNSIKYIGNGNKIEVALTSKKHEIYLTVKDNGMGIDTKDREKVFDRFYTVDKSRTDLESMGLGLSMVKQMVEINNGNITLDSELGKGTTITITF